MTRCIADLDYLRIDRLSLPGNLTCLRLEGKDCRYQHQKRPDHVFPPFSKLAGSPDLPGTFLLYVSIAVA